MKYRLVILLSLLTLAIVTTGCPQSSERSGSHSKSNEKSWITDFRSMLKNGQLDFFGDKYVQAENPFGIQVIAEKLSKAVKKDSKVPPEVAYLLNEAKADYEDAWQSVLTEQLIRLEKVYSVESVLPALAAFTKLTQFKKISELGEAGKKAEAALNELQKAVENKTLYTTQDELAFQTYAPNVSGESSIVCSKFLLAILDLKNAGAIQDSIWFIEPVVKGYENEMKVLNPSLFISTGRDKTLVDPLSVWSDLGKNYGRVFSLLDRIVAKGKVTPSEVQKLQQYLVLEKTLLSSLKTLTQAQFNVGTVVTSRIIAE